MVTIISVVTAGTSETIRNRLAPGRGAEKHQGEE
jgi:hypothetical protein